MELKNVKHQPTVYIVDQDPAERGQLAKITSAAGYRTLEFESGAEFLQSLAQDAWGCAVLDVRIQGVNESSVHKLLLERNPQLKIVIVTGCREVEEIISAMKNGAIDVLIKPVDGQVFLRSISEAMYQAEESQQKIVAAQQITSAVQTLSKREREVLEYVIGGYLNKEIAAELSITEKTVKVHRSRAMEKMHARALVDLVRACELADIQPRIYNRHNAHVGIILPSIFRRARLN